MATQLVKGNTAVIVGALYAGCDSFFGYPITPASEILHEAAKLFPQAGRRVVQAESEEAAINMVFGAAATGRRTMTASSGLLRMSWMKPRSILRQWIGSVRM